MTTNTACHAKTSNNAPPISGPSTNPRAPAAPAIPTAVARAGPSNDRYNNAIVEGIRNAAHAPVTARTAISPSALDTDNTNNDAHANAASPPSRTRRRPEPVGQRAAGQQQAAEEQASRR